MKDYVDMTLPMFLNVALFIWQLKDFEGPDFSQIHHG